MTFSQQPPRLGNQYEDDRALRSYLKRTLQTDIYSCPLALTLGRSAALALLARHAQWSLDAEHDGRASASARRFALSDIDLIAESNVDDAFALMTD